MKKLTKRMCCCLLFLSASMLGLSAAAQNTQEDVNQRAFSVMQSLFIEAWEPPEESSPDGPVTYSVAVKQDGSFESAGVITSSGDRAFDMSGIKALANTFPLPMWDQLNEPAREIFYSFKIGLSPQ